MKKHLPDLPMRDASTPFKLKLDEETGLPGLNDLFCAVNTKDLEYKYAYYQSVLFKERTLTMTTEDCDTRSKQEIKVKEDGLYVSCDCATQVSRLCSHVVTLFSQMIKDKRFNFFEPLKSFPFTDPKFYDKYLTIGSAYKSILATPKPEFGKIYKYESGVDSEKIKFQRFCNILPAEFEQGEETTAYVMAIHNSFGIPFFMLCSATLNIKRTAIKQFGSFVNPSLDLPTLDLDQKILYGLHRDFDKLINFESINKINRFKEPGRGEMRRTAFNYWKIIVPILKFKKYVFSHRLYARISYKSNHNKKEMFSFSFNDEQVRFQFLFTDISVITN